MDDSVWVLLSTHMEWPCLLSMCLLLSKTALVSGPLLYGATFSLETRLLVWWDCFLTGSTMLINDPPWSDAGEIVYTC